MYLYLENGWIHCNLEGKKSVFNSIPLGKRKNILFHYTNLQSGVSDVDLQILLGIMNTK